MVSVASSLLALVLFAAGSFVIVSLDDTDADMRDGDSFSSEVTEVILGAMGLAAPLALFAATLTASVLSRRNARPIEDAIHAAQQTTAHDLTRRLPVPDVDDELRDLVVSLNDLFARLDDGFAALARFAADASHELRTPLAVISTELEVALRHPRGSDEWQQTARTSLDGLRRLSSLVEGLLTLARAGADAPAARAPARLVECIDAVVAQLADAAERANITLTGPEAERDDEVEGNRVMIETAIRNLVENAIEAGQPGGHVRVTLEANGPGEASVIVDDDGPGLGADVESLFAPFTRGDRTQRGDDARRVGLGLAIARRIATAHGGRLETAVSPLGGARFLLTLRTRDTASNKRS